MSGEPFSRINTVPTDADVAQNIRDEIRPVLEQLAAILNRGKAHGLIVSFTMQQDQYGRATVTEPSIVRPL